LSNLFYAFDIYAFNQTSQPYLSVTSQLNAALFLFFKKSKKNERLKFAKKNHSKSTKK